MNTNLRIYFLSLLLGLTIPMQNSCAIENDNTLKDTATQTSSVEQDKVEKVKINPWRLAAKLAVGGTASLCAHYILEYITVFTHEHGHCPTGIVEIKPTGHPLAPWGGVNHSCSGSFLSIAAGPLAGLCATYLQCIAIETLDGYMQGKSLKESAQQGLRHPFLFFSQAKQAAKNYCSYVLNKKINIQINEPTLLSVMLHSLLFLRSGRMIGEFFYGLMPYYGPINGDGEQLWKMVFGDNCPTFKVNLPMLTLGILSVPYIVGALEAWRLENKDKASENFSDNQ